MNVRYTSGPAIERAGDLASVLTSLDDHDVLFIDEIHRLNRAVEEILYPAMEDYALDVMIGKGPSARSLRLSLKPFTVVGATTRAGRISGPLRDRFGATYRLDFYTDDELMAIVDRSAAILGVEIEPSATRAIARRGRGTPRIVNRLLKRVRDHAEVHGDGRVDEATAREAMRRDGDRRRGPRLDRPQAAGRDRPEVRVRAGRRGGAGGRPVGGGRDHRGRLRAVPAAARLHRPDARRGASPRSSPAPICAGLGYEIPPPRRTEPGMPGLWDDPLPAPDA